MPATPTAHTSSIFFGLLDQESSLEEQSSIDFSNIMDASTHTGSLLGGGQSAIAAENSLLASRRDIAGTSVLESVIEEPVASDEDHSQNKARPTRTPLRIDTTTTTPAAATTTTTTGPHKQSSVFSTITTIDNESSVLPTVEDVTPTNNTRHTTLTQDTSTFHVKAMPSRTIHTSNVNAESYKKLEEETDKYTAWIIHIALLFFVGLILSAILLTVFVIDKYGMVALMGLILLVSFAIFMAWFVDKTVLSKNVQLKPIRNKILRAVQVTKQAMVEEFHLFQRDWNEQLLLTNSSSRNEALNDDRGDSRGPRPAKNKKRSVVFKLIKPFFRLGRKMSRKKNKGKSATSSSTSTAAAGSSPYQPPAVESGVAV